MGARRTNWCCYPNKGRRLLSILCPPPCGASQPPAAPTWNNHPTPGFVGANSHPGTKKLTVADGLRCACNTHKEGAGGGGLPGCQIRSAWQSHFGGHKPFPGNWLGHCAGGGFARLPGEGGWHVVGLRVPVAIVSSGMAFRGETGIRFDLGVQARGRPGLETATGGSIMGDGPEPAGGVGWSVAQPSSGMRLEPWILPDRVLPPLRPPRRPAPRRHSLVLQHFL